MVISEEFYNARSKVGAELLDVLLAAVKEEKNGHHKADLAGVLVNLIGNSVNADMNEEMLAQLKKTTNRLNHGKDPLEEL